MYSRDFSSQSRFWNFWNFLVRPNLGASGRQVSLQHCLYFDSPRVSEISSQASILLNFSFPSYVLFYFLLFSPICEGNQQNRFLARFLSFFFHGISLAFKTTCSVGHSSSLEFASSSSRRSSTFS